MRAIQVVVTGGPEVLELREIAEPAPGPGEVSLDVAYAGVNFVEVMIRRGDKAIGELPVVPGFEVSGRVRALGPGVEGLRVGEPVAAMTVTGGYAEVAVARAHFVYPLDERAGAVDLKQGAVFSTIVPTADALLRDVARLQPSETVLIQAAAGGVGTVAGQIARHLGAGKILGTVSSREKAEYARRFGYDDVFLREETADAVRRATNGAGVDVVLESVGGPAFTDSLEVLAPMGRMVVFGNASATPFPSLAPGDLWFENKGVLGFSIGHLSITAPERLGRIARRAMGLLAEGHITVDITAVLPLEQAAEAHRRLESRATMGKLLLQVGA